MFESIVIRPNGARNFPIDYGQMIESMLYYGKTVVHIGRGEISSLFDLADVNILEELLKFSDLEMYFNNSHVGIINQDGILSLDSFGLANVDLEKELYEQSFEHSKDEFKSRKFAKKISRLIRVYQLPKTLNEALTEQIKDEDFRKKVLVESIERFPLKEKIDLKIYSTI